MAMIWVLTTVVIPIYGVLCYTLGFYMRGHERRIDELERRVDNNAAILKEVALSTREVAEAVLELAGKIQ